MADPILLSLVWHMHQPSYKDALTGRVRLPWTRLHATKDYGDMVRILRRHPRVHATFNLTPVLLDQLEAIAAGESDLFLDLARKPAESLTEEEQRLVLRHFFSVHPARLAEAGSRYRDLKAKAASASGRGPASGRSFTAEELRDIETWFHLAWIDSEYAEEEPVRSLRAKGASFTEEEKRSLLDWTVACASRVIGIYRDAERTGQIETTTSAHHHPILPLLITTDAPLEIAPSVAVPSPPFRAPEDAAEHLRRARESHTRRLGAAPRGIWPPEGAVSQAALTAIRAAGFAWCASDETALAAALGRSVGGEDWPGLLSRPYTVETERGPIAMVFRERGLSDRIGFAYMTWDAERAARDFLDRVLEQGRKARAGGAAVPVITVILDGENCWEGYPEDGRLFLDALYGGIEREPGLTAVTVSEALARVPPRDRLTRMPVGSWIAPELSPWIGHPEKNRAWVELRRVVERERSLGAEGTVPAERLAQAREEILIAEASDWFWWYGDDHQSAQKDEFDALFRGHLVRAYNLLGSSAPATIRRTLRSAPSLDEDRIPYIAPRVDGRDTDFYEWRNAELFDTASDQGADHRVTSVVRRVLFGLNEHNLFIRVDGVRAGAGGGAGATEDAIRLRFASPHALEARISLAGESRGALSWVAGAGRDVAPAGDAGEYAFGSVLEVRVPLALLGAGPGEVVHWSVALEQGGEVVEVVPRNGDLATQTLDPDYGLRNWSAT